ncbi:TPA: hypothetical protein ACH3X2_012181 [Trebouxia sp. C0005]
MPHSSSDKLDSCSRQGQHQTSQPDSVPAQGSPARSHQDVASNRRFNASVKRKPRTINFNTALPVNPTPPLYPHSLPLSAPDQPRDQAPPSDSPAQSPMPSSPSAHPRMLSDVSLVAIDSLPFASSESAAATPPTAVQPSHGHDAATEPIPAALCQHVGGQLADSPNTGLPFGDARSESKHGNQLRIAGSLPVQLPLTPLDHQYQQILQASTDDTRQLPDDMGAAAANLDLDPYAKSAASFLDDIISKSDKGTLFKGPVAASSPSSLQVSAPPSVTSGTATHEDAYSLNQGSHKQQADEAVHLASCSEEGVAPTVGRRKSSDQLGRALSSRDSMREGDFASLLLPGHSLSVSELDADLRGNSRASTSHPDSFLASPSTSTQPAAHTFPLSSAESLGHPVSKACRATVSTPIPASPDITTDPNDAQFRASSDGDLAAVMPEEVLCSASLVVDEYEHLVLTLIPSSQDVHDKDAHVLPAGHMAQLEGLDGMSYSDLTAMLVSRTVPQPHHLGTAQETPASLPIPGSPLAHHSHGAHAQNSFGHKDMRPSSHSMSIGSRHGADTDSVVPASAIHSSSISNRQVDASLQEAGTEAEYTCVPAQEQPAATAETVDVQSTVGASDQHNACQIPPAVHSGSKHPSEADAHDVLHVLAGVQSSDDLSMQQLQTLAGMDAQSSDGTTTLCDSAPESISSLDVDDRLPSLGQAAATHRPGAGHIDDSTVLGLSDLSTEVMSSSLYAEETENVPEQQRAGSAEGTAMPGMDDMLVSVSYEALDAGSPHCDSDDAGCQASADANPEASPRAVFQWEGGSSVTVTACEMLAEEGSGGSLYTAYLVEARSNLLQPSWIVRRRFRDFIRLRAALTSQPGVALSPAWDALSKAQSVRGQDRTAPHVVIQRQELLHTCLQELLALNSQSPTLSPLLAFLDPSLITCPVDTVVDTTPIQHASGSAQQPTQDSISASSEKHGSRIRLLTDAPVRFTDRELMLRQQGRCAECGETLPAVGTSWLGRTSSKAARRCEYTGQLYCHSCHTGATACLPAAVLRYWDFTPRPVCSMAAQFLEATAAQPLMCVNTINARLYAGVPAVGQAHELRKQACSLLAATRGSGNKAEHMVEVFLSADSDRRRLLEEPDYWAMSDLQDLQKGLSCSLLLWLSGAMEGASSLAIALCAL